MNRILFLLVLLSLFSSCDNAQEADRAITIEDMVSMYETDEEEARIYLEALEAEKVHIFDNTSADYYDEEDPYLVIDISNSRRMDSTAGESLPWMAQKVAQVVWPRTMNPETYAMCKVWVGTKEEVKHKYIFTPQEIDLGVYNYYYEDEVSSEYEEE